MNATTLLHVAAAAMLASVACSAQAAVVPFGLNTCGVGLQVLGQPRLGQTITIVGTGSLRFGTNLAPNWLMFGASSSHWAGVPLPLPMTTLFPSPRSCGDLLQSADVFQLMPEVPVYQPTVGVPIPVPNASWVLGFSFVCQTAQESHCLGYACAGGREPGLIASNAVFVRIGL